MDLHNNLMHAGPDNVQTLPPTLTAEWICATEKLPHCGGTDNPHKVLGTPALSKHTSAHRHIHVWEILAAHTAGPRRLGNVDDPAGGPRVRECTWAPLHACLPRRQCSGQLVSQVPQAHKCFNPDRYIQLPKSPKPLHDNMHTHVGFELTGISGVMPRVCIHPGASETAHHAVDRRPPVPSLTNRMPAPAARLIHGTLQTEPGPGNRVTPNQAPFFLCRGRRRQVPSSG